MLHYEVIGEGKPIILLHGLGCNLELMKGCMEPVFSDISSYKRIYIDLLGMGHSSAELSYASADKMLEALIDFIKEHINQNFLLIGESYGGYLAQGILANMEDNVDGMMLICPVILPDRNKRTLPTDVVRFMDEQYLTLLSKEERDAFCECAVLDMSGHNLQIEQPRLFNELTWNWLDRCGKQNCFP